MFISLYFIIGVCYYVALLQFDWELSREIREINRKYPVWGIVLFFFISFIFPISFVFRYLRGLIKTDKPGRS